MFGFSNLEDEIHTGNASVVVGDALRKLAVLREHTEQSIASGLTPNEFSKAEQLLIAISAAHRIMAATPQIKER